MRAELADGRVLEFPDGTDPAVIQATVKKVLGPAPPSNAAVAVNAADKGIAAIPDALLNTPNNIINLGKAAIGVPMAALGRTDLAPEPSPNPNYAHRAMKAMGFIQDAAEPQTPGQRVLDTAVQGGVGALAGPAGTGKQAIVNAIMGAAGGGSAGVVKEAGGSDNAAMSAAMLAQFGPAAAQRAVVGKPLPMNEVKAKTLGASREAGYVVPGSETNTGWVNRRIEDIAGKAATKQEAGRRNQENTNEIVAEDLGLPKKGVTEAAIEAKRYEAAEPYREVSALSPAAAKNMEKLKEVRTEAKEHWQEYGRGQSVQALKNAKALDKQAEMIEDVLGQIATRRGRPELVEELRAARTEIARLHDADRALNSSTGDISAMDLKRAIEKGKPLSGSLETAGRFAEAFPNYARDGASIPQPDVAKTNVIAAMLGAGTAGGGAAAYGLPPGAVGAAGVAGASLPYLAGPARSLALSKKYQELLQSSGKNPTEAQIRALNVARAIAEMEQ